LSRKKLSKKQKKQAAKRNQAAAKAERKFEKKYLKILDSTEVFEVKKEEIEKAVMPLESSELHTVPCEKSILSNDSLELLENLEIVENEKEYTWTIIKESEKSTIESRNKKSNKKLEIFASINTGKEVATFFVEEHERKWMSLIECKIFYINF